MSSPAIAPLAQRLTPLEERRLSDFSDRKAELEQFGKVLDSQERPIMVVFGEAGMGKSTLLTRMMHECALRGLRRANVEWDATVSHDYMAIMRRIKEQVGPEDFAPFIELMNYYTTEANKPTVELTVRVPDGTNISVAQNAAITNSTVGELGGIIVRDNNFFVQRPDLPIAESVRREQLTKRFVECLARTAQRSAVVVFLDAIDLMSSDTHAWMWGQLLNSLRTGELRNVKFVISGARPPPEDRDWGIFIEAAELKPFSLEDVVAFVAMRARGLTRPEQRAAAMMVFVYTNGCPGRMAFGIEMFLTMRER